MLTVAGDLQSELVIISRKAKNSSGLTSYFKGLKF